MLPKGEDYDNGFTKEMYEGGKAIMKEKKLVVTAPTEKEQERIKAWVKAGKQALSLEDRINKVFVELNITDAKIKDTIRQALYKVPIKNNDVILKQLIQTFYNSIDDEGNLA